MERGKRIGKDEKSERDERMVTDEKTGSVK